MEPSAWMRLEACWYLAASAECGVLEASSPAPGEVVSGGSQAWGSGTSLESGQLSRQVWPCPNQSGHSGPSPALVGSFVLFLRHFCPVPHWHKPGSCRGVGELGGFISCLDQGKR